KRSVLYSVLIVLFGALFVAAGYYLVGPIARASKVAEQYIFMATGLLLVFLFQPVKRVIDHATDRIFFRDQIDYQEVLTRIGEVISFEMDFDRLLGFLVDSFARELKIKHSAILLANKVGGGFKMIATSQHTQRNIRLTRKSPLVQWVHKRRDILITEEVDREVFDLQEGPHKQERLQLLNELRALKAELVSPVVISGQLRAILLFGEKLSGDIYAKADLDFFEVISPQIGTAIIKAQLYKEVSEFNSKLKKEIADATQELQAINLQLQQRNNFLISLQKITNLITRSLDFRNVFRVIVDGISSELRFAGGLLFLKGHTTHSIHLEEISHGPHYEDVKKFLPTTFALVPENSRRKENFISRAIRTGHIQIAVNFEHFISPPLSKQQAEKIQELLRFSSAIAVPIFSEDDIIGCIVFLVKKPKEQIQESDIQMMKSLADQTGVVTRNLRLYDQLAEANRNLKELDQVKSEFMSIASHQLRTPLSGIMGYISMMVDGDYGNFKPEQEDVLHQVLEASKRMIRLVNVFLNITRIEAGRLRLDRRKVLMNELVENVIKELKSKAKEKKMTLRFEKPGILKPIWVDPDKMVDVVLNLIDNAIKYTEKGWVEIRLEQNSQRVRCEVQDTGIGIPKEDSARLFEKFVRGSGSARIQPDGSGLGLFIAKKIVEAHGGTIGVESKGENKGSTFWFELPLKINSKNHKSNTEAALPHHELRGLYQPEGVENSESNHSVASTHARVSTKRKNG
ncbi:MAG: GAF domain-containing protein, partial [Candidatus Kerfeldbacteria bacterium]|nr:GAF domain-containing protein [Candidatus Kerfeldbacteria bacterium]